jgi:cysteinyl-tRNA synthetase
LANLFELTPIINSIKDNYISIEAIQQHHLESLVEKHLSNYILKIFLDYKYEKANDNDQLEGVMQLTDSIFARKQERKDYVTSDKIRTHLQQLGILLKDEKDGNMSYTLE